MKTKEKVFQDPQPALPPLNDHDLMVLRRVKALDPFRDKLPEPGGRLLRLHTLNYLAQRGLVRLSGSGLWITTKAGRAYLPANPDRGTPP
jgi:hypothetical protein